MEPRLGSVATTESFPAVAAAPAGQAAIVHRNEQARMIRACVAVIFFMMTPVSSVFVSGVGPDHRDPLDEEFVVAADVVEPGRRGVIASGMLELEAELLELRRLDAKDDRGCRLPCMFIVGKLRVIIAKPGPPPLGELVLGVTVAAEASRGAPEQDSAPVSYT